VARRPYLVGLISDTHGLLRGAAFEALQGSDLIVHAGDIGDPAVLNSLTTIGPVRAIRGNNDRGAWAGGLPATDVIELGTHSIYVLHNLAELDLDPKAAGFTIVVSGHSHKPAVEERGGILFVNPGSAGPRRFRLPVTVARLRLDPKRREAAIIPLAIAQQARKPVRST
jgi:putative phosphoesterase